MSAPKIGKLGLKSNVLRPRRLREALVAQLHFELFFYRRRVQRRRQQALRSVSGTGCACSGADWRGQIDLIHSSTMIRWLALRSAGRCKCIDAGQYPEGQTTTGASRSGGRHGTAEALMTSLTFRACVQSRLIATGCAIDRRYRFVFPRAKVD
jgi:hypothetical protein